MTVLAPDRMLWVADPVETVDSHGMTVRSHNTLRGPYPAHAETDTNGVLTVLLDPDAWPLAPYARLCVDAAGGGPLVVQPVPEHVGATGPWHALAHVRAVCVPLGLARPVTEGR